MANVGVHSRVTPTSNKLLYSVYSSVRIGFFFTCNGPSYLVTSSLLSLRRNLDARRARLESNVFYFATLHRRLNDQSSEVTNQYFKVNNRRIVTISLLTRPDSIYYDVAIGYLFNT